MAGVKISNLPAIVTPAATDVFPVVQSGVTYKESVTQLGTLLLLLTGGTMTGALVLSGDPTSNLEAATKQYVDAVATGLNIQGSCSAATTANLAGYVYDNGVAGVGATLTAGSNGAFSVDGVSPSLNDRILVKDQTAPAQNGIYTLTQVGDGSNPAILTRATDFDTPAEIQPGDYVLVLNGTVNASTAWVQTATVTAVGTDAIVWDQFSADVNTIITNIQDNSYLYAADTGAANAYVAALSPAVSTLPEGMVVLIKIANTNTTSSTLNLNGLGADSILDETGAALKPGDLTAGAYVMFVRTASNWRIVNRNIERRIQDSSFTRAIDTGAADAYVAALIPALPAYTFGSRVDLLVANSNTGASTINVNGLGAKNIILSDGSALTGGEMVANHVASLIYNGTDFEIINAANTSTINPIPQAVQVFTANGTYTPTAGTRFAKVCVWGAGGGGGGNTNPSFCGGAGGAGAYVEGFVSVSGSVTITIATGGTGATANTTNNGGSASGNTSYGTTAVAVPGNPGNGAAGGATGGTGGLASGCTVPSVGFALDGGDGSSTNIFSGFNGLTLGGSSPMNTSSFTNTTPVNGKANSGQGGGGGTTISNGGQGGSGKVIIYEYM